MEQWEITSLPCTEQCLHLHKFVSVCVYIYTYTQQKFVQYNALSPLECTK